MTDAASRAKTMMITVVVLALLGAFIGGAIWWKKSRGELGFVAAVPLGDGSLAVIEARHRVLVVDASGHVIRTHTLRERLTPYFWTPELLLFRAGDQSVYALNLPDLNEAAEFNEEVESHHALRGVLTNPSVLPDGRIAVQGRNGRHYVVDAQGHVERTETPLRGAGIPRWETSGHRRVIVRTTGSIPGIDGAPNLSRVDLVQPGAVMRWGRGEAVSFTDPPGVLVLSSDVVGDGANDILSRVALDGTIVWSAPVAPMIEHTMGAAVHHLLWADVQGDEVVALVQAFRVTRSEAGTTTHYAQRLVRLSAVDGAVRSAVPITRGDE